jgi:arylsulfatase
MQKKTKSGVAKSNDSRQPNILYFHIDNLGQGELGCYDGGLRRGAARSQDALTSSRARV